MMREPYLLRASRRGDLAPDPCCFLPACHQYSRQSFSACFWRPLGGMPRLDEAEEEEAVEDRLVQLAVV